MKTEKVLLGIMTVYVALGVAAADVTDVTVRQRWPWSRLVDIDYILCNVTQGVDIAVTAYDGTTTLTLPSESLSGDLYGVSTDGRHRIVWTPTVTAYTNLNVLSNFRVALTPAPSPLYMIVDLTNLVAGAKAHVEYVYESNLVSGAYGSVQTNPVEGVHSIIWTDVTNAVYKTDRLVLRRVSAGGYKMGSSTNIPIALTKDFYVGVFEVTQRQWERVAKSPLLSRPSNFTADYMARPVEKVSYDNIRGATNSASAIDWPTTGTTVLPTSFLGLLRSTTGISDFDLPTEAQWEYACRAETSTLFHDGNWAVNVNGTNSYTNAWMDVLGRYRFNGGKIGNSDANPPSNCSTTNGTAFVGSYLPNAWGIYDMHGNVFEWVLDWDATRSGGADPVGGTSGAKRVYRGGSWCSNASGCTSASRGTYFKPSDTIVDFGFRVVRTLP